MPPHKITKAQRTLLKIQDMLEANSIPSKFVKAGYPDDTDSLWVRITMYAPKDFIVDDTNDDNYCMYAAEFCVYLLVRPHGLSIITNDIEDDESTIDVSDLMCRYDDALRELIEAARLMQEQDDVPLHQQVFIERDKLFELVTESARIF
jgi:hypothetical protein